MSETVTFDLAAPPPANREVDLGQGVVAVLRPWSGLLASALDVATALDAQALRDGEGLDRWGLEPADVALLANPIAAAGFMVTINTAARASLRIDSWNVTDEAGAPVPTDRFTLARFFTYGLTPGSGAEHLQAYALAEEG